jgi:hypothetical protein
MLDFLLQWVVFALDLQVNVCHLSAAFNDVLTYPPFFLPF